MGNKFTSTNENFKCPKGHKLVYLPKCNYQGEIFICDFCKRLSNARDEVYNCDKCQFDCCSHCKQILDFSYKNYKTIFCRNKHELKPSFKVPYDQSIFRCDICRQLSKQDEFCMRCSLCNYDICICCSSVFGNKEINLTIEKINICDEIKCNNHHNLKYEQNPVYSEGYFICDICKRKSLDDSCSIRCGACNYDVCLSCYYLKHKILAYQNKIKDLKTFTEVNNLEINSKNLEDKSKTLI